LLRIPEFPATGGGWLYKDSYWLSTEDLMFVGSALLGMGGSSSKLNQPMQPSHLPYQFSIEKAQQQPAGPYCLACFASLLLLETESDSFIVVNTDNRKGGPGVHWLYARVRRGLFVWFDANLDIVVVPSIGPIVDADSSWTSATAVSGSLKLFDPKPSTSLSKHVLSVNEQARRKR
jgi:hypothetical protein